MAATSFGFDGLLIFGVIRFPQLDDVVFAVADVAEVAIGRFEHEGATRMKTTQLSLKNVPSRVTLPQRIGRVNRLRPILTGAAILRGVNL